MAIIFDPFDKYENITGKIIDINDGSTLTISVTFPFVSEIKVQCISEHYDILHPPTPFKYNWMDPQGSHPNISEDAAYYNTNDKCFYRKEFGRESEWERTDFEDIYDDNPNLLHFLRKNLNMQEKYNFFLSKYKSILHKGQLCRFSAYAIYRDSRNWRSIQNTLVGSNPSGYTWIYDPDTFYAEKWDAESIDGLVKEILPSRECLEESLKRHDAADDELRREKWKEKWERIKSAPERFQNWLAKYNQIWYFFATFLAGALGTLIATFIINRNK